MQVRGFKFLLGLRAPTAFPKDIFTLGPSTGLPSHGRIASELCIDCANPQITIVHKRQALGSSVSVLLDARHVMVQDYLETGRCNVEAMQAGTRFAFFFFAMFSVLSKYGSSRLTITTFSLPSPN